MTREETIDRLKEAREGHKEFLSIETLNKAIKALKQDHCEDCISRKAVENITWEEPSYTDALNVLTEVREKVRELPSVTPQPKIGQWIKKDGYSDCSECGSHIVTEWDYCPHCGAKMESEEV